MSDQKDENAGRTSEWEDFTENFDYEKMFYDVLLPNGQIVEMCWLNNGFMNAFDNNEQRWSSEDGVMVRPSSRHPLDDCRGKLLVPSVVGYDGKIKYLITYGGGLGPNAWDDEMEVEADSVRGAIDIAEPKIQEIGGQVFSVEQAELGQ